MAAAAGVLFLGLMVVAVRILRHAVDWGLLETGSLAYLLPALVGAGVLVLGRSVVGSGVPDLPVKGIEWRVSAVLATSLLAGVPWVVIVWRAHETCRLLASRIGSLPPAVTTGASSNEAPSPRRDLIEQLLRLWNLVERCVGAFALAVVAALVGASMLRAAFLEAHPDGAARFPAANVFYYGVLFAALASLLNLPLIAAWRRSARAVVDRTYPLPPDGLPTGAWVAGRGRLEGLLHLDVSLLRSPLTALTVLSPLLTSAVAAFVPPAGG
ncbi:hypothetical protein [Kribbella sp. NPDC048915]|uniref:hypothetical protein n=1 Tax=Kribbella sp. NPDC048915 TaxID=3155148 RepID=UPI0033FB7B1E